MCLDCALGVKPSNSRKALNPKYCWERFHTFEHYNISTWVTFITGNTETIHIIVNVFSQHHNTTVYLIKITDLLDNTGL